MSNEFFSEEVTNTNPILKFSLNRPILLIVFLFIISVLFKLLDSFLLRLDELLGEAILTKGLGLLLVIAFLWAAGKKLSEIGFHSRYLTISLLLSGIGFLLIYVVAFLIQLILLWSGGEPAGLALTAVDPKTSMTGGFWFGLWLFVTNLINSGMEEGLFRGVMIRHLLLKVSGWGAVLISAGFFAIWHLSWPIKHYLDGTSTLGEAGFEAFSLVLATFIAGLIYGYLYLKTSNLWGPFLGHTINNTVLNVLYYQTNSGLRAATEFMTFMMVVLLGYLILIPVTAVVAKRWELPELKPWG